MRIILPLVGTNPIPANTTLTIIGFNVDWVNVANVSDRGKSENVFGGEDFSPGARVIYNIITGPTQGNIYRITIVVLYRDADPVNLGSVRTDQPGGDDMDDDGIKNADDDCPIGDTNWKSNAISDNDGDGCRDDSPEDPDDDNDQVPDTEDAFRLDACASIDTDGDGDPGYVGISLHYRSQYQLNSGYGR